MRIKAKGMIKIYENGKLVYTKHNMVVDTGLNLIAKALKGIPTNLTHIAIGDNPTPESRDQTTLLNEKLRLKVTDSTTGGCKLILSLTVPSDVGNFHWQEMGIFTAQTNGTMFSRAVIDYTKNAGVSVDIEYTITLSDN